MSRYCVIDRGKKILRPLLAAITSLPDSELRLELQSIHDELAKAVLYGNCAADNTERGRANLIQDYLANKVFGAANTQLARLQAVIDNLGDDNLRHRLQQIHDRFASEVIVAGGEAAVLLAAEGINTAGKAVARRYEAIKSQRYEAKANK